MIVTVKIENTHTLDLFTGTFSGESSLIFNAPFFLSSKFGEESFIFEYTGSAAAILFQPGTIKNMRVI